ncbi:low temperature requirement protein A [Franzmannia qiaohouensis]|uniref:Low temperature requirement protein A n=1 Tax=Franzmannia qiaohouensis TaxID=1329370 RepID=A0ABU1HLV7_9GAMM|nr:low temperature requirement protein A [Halomonas qiaohouensis]MDR5907560.1 low temperature requirement protein A [Halomonas qiaohouensis]
MRLRHRLPEPEAAKPSWLELFYDLVFVAVFIQIGERLSHDLSTAGFLQVLALFAPLWWVWANVAWYMNRFAVDDVVHRLLLLVQLFFIAWMGLSVPDAFGAASTQFVICYIGFRATMIAMYARSLHHAPDQRELLLRHISHFHLPGALLWAGSLLLPVEWRPWVWVGTFLWEAYNAMAPRFLALLKRFPAHTHHLIERFGTLIILVLGETFIKSITVASPPPLSLDTVLFSAPAIATFFGLWWLYFSAIDNAAARVLCEDNPAPWLLAHLPLALVLITSAVAKTKLFESVFSGYLDPFYSALYLGSLALFLTLLCLVAGNRRPPATRSRLAAATLFVLLIPITFVWSTPPALLAGLATAIIAGLILREHSSRTSRVDGSISGSTRR